MAFVRAEPFPGQAASDLAGDSRCARARGDRKHEAGAARVSHALLQRPSEILGSLQSSGKPPHPAQLQGAASLTGVTG